MTASKKKAFGRSLRSEFFLEPDYVPLNHGSFGTLPRCIQALRQELQVKAQANPDRFLRRTMFPELARNRDRVAALVHCDPQELTFVLNASYGVNSVMRSFPFNPGDKLICFTTAYNAVERTLAFLQDAHKVKLIPVQLTYPLSDQEILNITRETIENEMAKGKEEPPIRMAVFDAISSVPGVRFPFETMIGLMKEYGIYSLVDGAHAIGQVPLNLHEADPDFFVSNCHKWLFAPAGAAILYVPKRNQHLVHPSIINYAYRSHQDPGDKTNTFQEEFAWPGTQDFSNFMCIEAALDFRESLGGEEAIQSYCNQLAREGGQLVAEKWGTEVLENADNSLTVAMVNVRLPLKNPKPGVNVTEYFIDKLLFEHKTIASVYPHNGKWYVRFSAQVYNDLDDFKYGADAILKVCKGLEQD